MSKHPIVMYNRPSRTGINNSPLSVIVPALVTLIIGMLFAFITVSQQQSALNVSNLPALIEKVSSLERELNSERDLLNELRAEVAASLDKDFINASFDTVNARVSALEGQVARRFTNEVLAQQELMRNYIERDLDRINLELREIKDVLSN